MGLFSLLVKLPIAIAVDVVNAPVKLASAVVHGSESVKLTEVTEKVLEDTDGE